MLAQIVDGPTGRDSPDAARPGRATIDHVSVRTLPSRTARVATADDALAGLDDVEVMVFEAYGPARRAEPRIALELTRPPSARARDARVLAVLVLPADESTFVIIATESASAGRRVVERMGLTPIREVAGRWLLRG